MHRGFDRVDERFVRLEQKSDGHFMWLVGILLVVLTAVVGALAGVLGALSRSA